MAVAAALGLSLVAAQTARRSPPESSWIGIQRTPRGTFRFDDRGRLIEEFVRTDNRSFLRQLGAEVA